MYCELHLHSCFSFREGASTPIELALQASRLGYAAIALTDHDNLAGAMEFARACKEWGVRPITGAEITLSDGHHLTLLAESPRGYANLSRLLTRANLENPRGRPRVDPGWLPEHAEGLIALSGCRKGEVPALVEAGDLRGAKEAAERLKAVFGRGSFFLELQDNLSFTDEPRIAALVRLAGDLRLPYVATNNVHYHVRERHRLHDVLTAVRANTTLEEARPLLRPNSEFYLKSPREMEAVFADLPLAVRQTEAIAERCTGVVLTSPSHDSTGPARAKTRPSFERTHDDPGPIPTVAEEDARRLPRVAEPRGVYLADPAPPLNGGGGFDLTRDLSYQFPDYESPDGRSADDLLAEVCLKRARELYRGPMLAEVQEKVAKELEIIRSGRRAGFFLRMWELMKTAHEQNLPARGRGSSVGSLVCYLLGLSGIDPVRYKLFVGRFLNEARLEEDVPDIDIDFGRDARDTMFRTIFDKYGTEYAAQVCNFIQYRYASAIRDVGKALGLPPGDIDKVAKRMRSRFASSLAQELGQMPEFAQTLRSPIWQDFFRLVEELRGFPRHLSQHSGGVIISTTRMDEQVPVERPAMEGRFICQWDKDSVADAGMIKLDLLAYPTLDQLYRAIRYVKERHGRVIDPATESDLGIPLDDPGVYEMIQEGDSIGIVQIQSRAQIQVLLRIRVKDIHDLVIQVALIRPGPIQGGAVNPYIARSLGQEPVTYDHPALEEVLGETKGVFIFQEQVIQAAMAIAGFTPGQAELLRRAMSRKRSREAMEALRQAFLEGARANGVSAPVAATVYEKILAFAEFGFPKSHAAAMAETAYKVAWLKRYYPPEFYCALLNEQPMGFYSEEVICNDARRHGIEVRGIDINHSRVECTIEDFDSPSPSRERGLGGEVSSGTVRLGYRYVKAIGEASWPVLDEEAAKGPYVSLWDFWRRTRLSREAIENLIRLGAFAFTGLHERELLWQLGTFYQPLSPVRKETGARPQPLQLTFAADVIPLREMTHKERVIADLVLTGVAVRGHSMDLVQEYLHEGIAPSKMVADMEHGRPVTVAGLVAVRQAPETAKGFVFHTLEDYFGHVNVITKPDLVPKYRALIESAPALIVHGHIERQERAVNVVAERFEAIPVTAAATRRIHSFG
jgi:error-prone DNA polymerase